jgi:hypothetical protein
VAKQLERGILFKPWHKPFQRSSLIPDFIQMEINKVEIDPQGYYVIVIGKF